MFSKTATYVAIVLFIISCSAVKLTDKGWTCIEKKELIKAIELFNKAIKKDPQYAYAYNGRGVAYTMQNQCDLAVPDFIFSIQNDPSDRSAYNNLGLAYCYLYDYEKATKIYDALINSDPNDKDALSNRSQCYMKMGKYEEAIKDLDYVIANPETDNTLFCGLPCLYMLRGECYGQLKMIEFAKQDYKKALESDPKKCEIYYSRGVCLFENGLVEEAKKDFQTMIGLPTCGDYEKACAMAWMGDITGAVKLYQEFYSKENKDYLKDNYYLYNLACLYAMNRDIETSLNYLEKAFEISTVDVKWSTFDPDLKPIRETNKFQELQKKYATIER